jgi:hypothetical protein
MRLPSHRFGVVLLLAFALTGCDLANLLTVPTPEQGLAIKKFVATPDSVAAGGGVTLDWEVVGAQSIEVDNGIGAVVAKGTREVRPSTTTVYTLTAQGKNAAASAAVRVTVR